MAVQEQVPYVEYVGNGVTKAFPVTFDFEDQKHLIVMIDEVVPAVGQWQLLDERVEFTTPPKNGALIEIKRDTPLERSTTYQTYNNSFRPEPVNRDFDRIWRKLQELGLSDWLLGLKLDKEIRDRIAADIYYYTLTKKETDQKLSDLKDYIDSLVNNITGEAFLPILDRYIKTWSGRSQEDVNKDRISILDFPKLKDTWEETIQAADIYCYNNNKILYFPNMTFKCADGIIKRAHWSFEQMCNISVFPLEDDKVHMVGEKKLPGTSLLFVGSGKKCFNTNTSKFGVVRFAVMNIGREKIGDMGCGFDNVCIISDFDFKDSMGVTTTPLNDNRADYDVGLLFLNSELTKIDSACVAGYWKKSGTMHFGTDPDNISFYNLRTMGNIGLSIISNGSGTNSGFNGYSCVISANDHHSRYTGAGEDWGECALYIDIPNNLGSGSRNGINFFGGSIATKVNTPVKYDRCGDIVYHGTVFENADQAGSRQAGGPKRQIGTENTGSISFIHPRFSSDQVRSAGGLLDTAPNSKIIFINGDSSSGVEIWYGKNGIRLTGNKNQQNIQMTSDPTISTSGIVLRRTSSDNVFRLLFNNKEVTRISDRGLSFQTMDSSNLTIVSNTISVSRNKHKITGGVTDLISISGGQVDQRLLLNTLVSADKITLKDSVGNLRLNGDCLLESGQNYIELIFDGQNWCELSRSINS